MKAQFISIGLMVLVSGSMSYAEYVAPQVGGPATQAEVKPKTKVLVAGETPDFYQGETFQVLMHLNHVLPEASPTDDPISMSFNVTFCTCDSAPEHMMTSWDTTPATVMGSGMIMPDRQTVKFDVDLNRRQALGTYRLVRAYGQIGPKHYDFVQQNFSFTVSQNTKFTTYQAPVELSAEFDYNLTKKQLLHVRIKALKKAVLDLRDDLKPHEGMSVVTTRIRLQRSLHDESELSAQTESRYLNLTDDLAAKKAAKISFDDVQERYTALRRANQIGALRDNPHLQLASYEKAVDNLSSLEKLQADLEDAMLHNEEIFEAMEESGDYIKNVVVQTDPQQARVVCKTKAGEAIAPIGLTNTIFEHFPYAQFHCEATLGKLKGEIDYNSARDTHHLIQIPLK